MFPDTPEYSRYWDAVVSLSSLEYDRENADTDEELLAILEEQDQYLPQCALMEATGMFSDAQMLDKGIVLPSPLLSMTTRGLPDVCGLVPHVAFWGQVGTGGPKSLEGITVLLGRALPNPCKSRALDTGLIKDLLDPESSARFRDLVLRVLFACILGVYQGATERPSLHVRMLAYHAFVLVPPSAAQLARFVDDHKMFVVIAFREFLFFSIDQVPSVKDYLEDVYQWSTMRNITRETADSIRALIDHRATGFDLLTDTTIWNDVEMKASSCHQKVLKHVYRAVTTPLYMTLLSEFRALALPEVPTLQQYREAYRYAAEFKTTESLESALTDIQTWGRLPVAFRADMDEAALLYNSETNLTACTKIIRTMAKEAPDDYNALYAFLVACKWRLGLRWEPLPALWAQRQAAALCSRYGGHTILPDFAGIYFICPKCLEIRSPPASNDSSKQRGGFFARDVCIWVDGVNIRLVCKARNKRKQNAREKRNRRNNPDSTSRKSQDQMCNGIELLRVHMVGVLLYTERDKLLALCVHCGVLLKWCADAMTADGPSCGCLASAAAAKEATDSAEHTCVICENRTKRLAWHTFLTESGTTQLPVCSVHRTRWIETLDAVPSLSEVREAVLGKRRSVFIAGKRVVVHRKKFY